MPSGHLRGSTSHNQEGPSAIKRRSPWPPPSHSTQLACLVMVNGNGPGRIRQGRLASGWSDWRHKPRSPKFNYRRASSFLFSVRHVPWLLWNAPTSLAAALDKKTGLARGQDFAPGPPAVPDVSPTGPILPGDRSHPNRRPQRGAASSRRGCGGGEGFASKSLSSGPRGDRCRWRALRATEDPPRSDEQRNQAGRQE